MIEVVCAVILDDMGKVLVAQRPPGKAQAGRWEFPGGKIEPGESAEAALLREIEEELGCRLSVGAALRAVEHTCACGVVRLLPFTATVKSGHPQAFEHSALRWVTLEEAAGLDWVPADLPILAELAAQRVGAGPPLTPGSPPA